jgi:hypothetical protein
VGELRVSGSFRSGLGRPTTAAGPRAWTADPEAIVEKVRRGYHALASIERLAG